MTNQNKELLPATNFINKDNNGEYYLSGSKCDQCNSIFIGDRNSCGKCFRTGKMKEIRLANSGKLYSYSIVHRSFPGIDVPYVSAIVDLDEGGTIKGNLINIKPDPDKIKFDMKVKVIFKDALGRKDKEGNSYISYFFEPE